MEGRRMEGWLLESAVDEVSAARLSKVGIGREIQYIYSKVVE